jgi:primosomal protein N' (replication factor Y) (superfamily II helicase)
LIELITKQDYLTAFKVQMEERKLFSYPPWSRLIKLAVKHKKPEILNRTASQLADRLKANRYMIGTWT